LRTVVKAPGLRKSSLSSNSEGVKSQRSIIIYRPATPHPPIGTVRRPSSRMVISPASSDAIQSQPQAS
jgi:hypothetical protein